MSRLSLAAAALISLSLMSLPARADDGMTSFHYQDLEHIQQGVTSLGDLKGLRVGLFITSKLPDVPRDSIKLTIHRASGTLVDIPVDAAGRIDLPQSAELVTENPLIFTNQPKHTLNATVLVDLTPLTTTQMSYADLMLGIRQFNTGIDRKGIMASLYASKAKGLLLFYNDGEHALTLQEGKTRRVIKSLPAGELKAHLQYIQTKQLIDSITVIYVPLDEKLLKENPPVSLDRLPDDSFPAS